MTANLCASRCPTCCSRSVLPFRRLRRRKRSSPQGPSDETSCLILDVGLPGMSRTGSSTGIETPREGHPDRLHHRARATSRSVRASSPPERWRACSSHSATRRCSKRRNRGWDEVSMTTMLQEQRHTAAVYCEPRRLAARRTEVVTMADVNADRFRRRRRHLGARIAGAAHHTPVGSRDIRIGAGFPVSSARHCSLLSGARRHAAGAQRSRTAAAARRAHRHADHLHHRVRRRADERARDEGRSGRVPDEAVQGRCACGRDSAAPSSGVAPPSVRSRRCGSCGTATPRSLRANAR